MRQALDREQAMLVSQLAPFHSGGIAPAAQLGEAPDRLGQEVVALSSENLFPPGNGRFPVIDPAIGHGHERISVGTRASVPRQPTTLLPA